MMRNLLDTSIKLRREVVIAAFIGSIATAPVEGAAPLSVFGVGFISATGLPGEMYRFSESGTMTRKWDIPESRGAIAIATYGINVYVAGLFGPINRYDTNGVFLGEFADVHGMAGSTPNKPFLETDSRGNVYIAYSGNSSLPRTSFRLANDGNISAAFSHPDLVFPSGIDATANGDVYILNSANVGVHDRLFRFDSGGGYLGDFPIPQTDNPSDIAVNEISNELYISDEFGQAIAIYDISSGAPNFLDTLSIPGYTIDVFVEPTSGRVFGTYLVFEEDDLGLYSRFNGFELSRDGGLTHLYIENAPPRQQSVHGIVAVPVPEPTTVLMLVIATVGGSWRYRHSGISVQISLEKRENDPNNGSHRRALADA